MTSSIDERVFSKLENRFDMITDKSGRIAKFSQDYYKKIANMVNICYHKAKTIR